jgi:serine/threonine-protein kinase HipA
VGQNGIDELFRRMAFNVMARNCDDHVKNLSFILKRGGSWDLAPAYDVSYAYMPGGEWTYQHQMSVNGRFDDLKRNDFLREADRFGVRSPEKILEEVADALGSFEAFAAEAGVTQATTKRIRRNFCEI